MFGRAKAETSAPVAAPTELTDKKNGARLLIDDDVPDGHGILVWGPLYAPVTVNYEPGDADAGEGDNYETGYFVHALSGQVEAYLDIEQARAYLWHVNDKPDGPKRRASALLLPSIGGNTVRLL